MRVFSSLPEDFFPIATRLSRRTDLDDRFDSLRIDRRLWKFGIREGKLLPIGSQHLSRFRSGFQVLDEPFAVVVDEISPVGLHDLPDMLPEGFVGRFDLDQDMA